MALYRDRGGFVPGHARISQLYRLGAQTGRGETGIARREERFAVLFRVPRARRVGDARQLEHPHCSRKVDIRLPGEGDFNSRGARPVY